MNGYIGLTGINYYNILDVNLEEFIDVTFIENGQIIQKLHDHNRHAHISVYPLHFLYNLESR